MTGWHGERAAPKPEDVREQYAVPMLRCAAQDGVLPVDQGGAQGPA